MINLKNASRTYFEYYITDITYSELSLRIVFSNKKSYEHWRKWDSASLQHLDAIKRCVLAQFLLTREASTVDGKCDDELSFAVCVHQTRNVFYRFLLLRREDNTEEEMSLSDIGENIYLFLVPITMADVSVSFREVCTECNVYALWMGSRWEKLLLD